MVSAREPEFDGLNGSDLISSGSDLDAALGQCKLNPKNSPVEVNCAREHRADLPCRLPLEGDNALTAILVADPPLTHSGWRRRPF
jgi:hypothetical protein